MSDAPSSPRTPTAEWLDEPVEPFSFVFRPSGPRARNAVAALALLLLVAALTVAHHLSGFDVLDQAARGELTFAEGQAYDRTTLTILFFNVIVSLAAAITFLAWLSRAIDNTPVLRAGIPSATPRWSIGWWFVPIANAWKPYRIVRDLEVRMAGATHPGRWLVDAWWVVWLVGGVVLGFVVRIQTITTIEGLRNSLAATLAVEASNIIALVLAIVMVWHIQRHADLRAAAVSPPTEQTAESAPSTPNLEGGAG